jgi:hypothetical protein
MSDKMRRYMIVFWILLILSVFHFALAAPIAVGEILEVRSNSADVLKDGVAAWEKRMDRWSSNEANRKPNDNEPGSDSDPDGVPDSESPLEVDYESGQTESDARGPDRYYNNPLGDDLNYDSDFGESAESDNSNDGANSDDSNDSSKSDDSDDGAKSDNSNDGAKSDDSDDGNDNNSDDGSHNSGYDGDSEDSEDSDLQSGHGSAPSPGPKPERPAILEHITNFAKKLKGLFKRRSSGSGAMGAPKRELQGTVD